MDGSSIPNRGNIFPPLKHPQWLRAHPAPCSWLPGSLPPSTILLRRETTHSHLSSEDTKYAQNYNSGSSVFLHMVRTDKLTSIICIKSEGISTCLYYCFACNTSSFFVTTTFIHHSFSNLCDDRSNAPSKTVPPVSAI
jgi:hypothetical protein